MTLQPFRDEELNYFKFAFVVLNEFPNALRQTFKQMWDKSYGYLPGYQPWDDSTAVRNLFLGTEGGKTKVPTHLSYDEWDCTALFYATIFARSFALSDSTGHHRTLSDLYLKPHKLLHGTFHASVVSPSGNTAETIALAIDQLRHLTNSLCQSTSSEIDKPTFDQYIHFAKDAFKALGVKTDAIDAIRGLSGSAFPTEGVCKLEQDIKFLKSVSSDIDELRMAIKGKVNDTASKEDIATGTVVPIEVKLDSAMQQLDTTKVLSMMTKQFFATHAAQIPTEAIPLCLNYYLQGALGTIKGTHEVMTPLEILARGPLAVQVYNKAIEEGKTNVRRLPIMLIGQGGMGKTSLKKSLKGDLFDPEEESTTGIEVDPSYCKMTTEIWRPGKLDETTSPDSAVSFEQQAAQLIMSDMNNIKETSQTTSMVSNTKEWDKIPDDIAPLITKLMFEDTKVDEEEQIYFTLWDFSGQSVYYVTHPLFLTTQAIFLLVHNLSQSPNDRAIPVLKHGLFRKLEDSYSVKTNLDYLDSWMSSVASLVSDGDDGDSEVPVSYETEKLPSKLPPVFLVCTHADQPYCSQASHTLAADIFNYLKGKPYSSHLFDSVFAVDNTKSGSLQECPEVVRLRKEIIAVAKELPQMKELIPLKWLKFEKELQTMILEGYKWISLENANQVAIEMCHISEEEEFTTLMKFLHDQRTLIHFDDTPSLNKMVVLDIQWLINVFKKVITVQPYGRGETQYKELWLKLMNTGILEEKLLEHVWGPLCEDKETFESLIEIMEKFSLLCIWPSSDESKQYLVPSMLMSHPSEDIIRPVASSQIPSLYLTFNSSQVPIGLFPRMVLQFYQWCSKEWPSPCEPQLYCNCAKFHLCPDEGCSVILLCHASFIEIIVHGANEDRAHSERLQSELKLSPNLASDPTLNVRIARAVRRQLGLMLECMRKEFVWLKNMICEMKVLCPVCCPRGSVLHCRVHGTKSCKQEECLHFLSETNLQSGQQSVICDRPPAGARDVGLNIKRFASWFPFLDEQQAIDECAARELPSIEEKKTKTLELSTGVLESLQSACDASNVVAQLQDDLQLNKAALADPEPETILLIRCLATMAKSEKRPDVVECLRQIVPAGTTGPLLPERLDVLKIPSSLATKLTITLCCVEEWKLVAEKLGLSSTEIRYLDKRTMNPSIEALVHSRKQRFINVGTLYNVLVECGLPMLADLL